MSEITAQDIRARLNAASWKKRPNEWTHVHISDGIDEVVNYLGGGLHERVCTCSTPADAKFIAHAPQDIAFLLEQNARLEAVVSSVRHLREYWRTSLNCEANCEPENNFHEPECYFFRELDEALAKLDGAHG